MLDLDDSHLITVRYPAPHLRLDVDHLLKIVRLPEPSLKLGFDVSHLLWQYANLIVKCFKRHLIHLNYTK